MSAGRICSRVVVTALPDELVRIAARRMAEKDVGTLVVLRGDGADEAVGVVTDRDIALRCVARGLNPDATPISMIMTQPVRAVDEDMPVEEAVMRMAEAATRRLVVTGGDNRLVGILSLDDVMDLLASEVGSIGRLVGQRQPHVPA